MGSSVRNDVLKKNKRRRKKRRTEDFSSDSDSSDSDNNDNDQPSVIEIEVDDDSDQPDHKKPMVEHAGETASPKPDLISNLSPSEIDSLRIRTSQARKKLNKITLSNFENELQNKNNNNDLSETSFDRSSINLSAFKNHIKNRSNILNRDINDILNTDDTTAHTKDNIDTINTMDIDENLSPLQIERKNSLLDDYLSLLINTYDDDLDKLRSSSDFNNNTSLILLANLLKNSGNIFSIDNLDMILNKH
ncbi:uncharacterized protein ASCRUDRAFT_74417 [Ascoidea rubescens DSM 1968]|uniref:Ribosome assembly protein 3 n=1 Tax=Ascoidea rubescens DSM 1968 TaxID=1344418 RepID=A0A1D2VN12_9ASCO|nr:hypothetical protein ASCRUDRAFT_74417 [Ascoidea rubescens DSM 1968]ODV62990.1 hypothetical protein ASCRUDRAFT_74417 [Ascoidea rubescens DSM 1968]